MPKPTYYLVKAARCSHCGGTGCWTHPVWEPCPACDGLGSTRDEVRLEEVLRELLPQLLAEAEARERASLEAADAAALAAEWEVSQ